MLWLLLLHVGKLHLEGHAGPDLHRNGNIIGELWRVWVRDADQVALAHAVWADNVHQHVGDDCRFF